MRIELTNEVIEASAVCANCIFYHCLKHNFETGKGFKESHACDVLLHVPDTSDEAWIQEVEPWGRCELFSQKVEEEA